MKKLLLLAMLLVLPLAATAATQADWELYYQTKADLKLCETPECIQSLSQKLQIITETKLGRRELYEWAVNNEAYYLIQLFKKVVNYTDTMAILDSGYGENLSRAKAVVKPNASLLYTAVAVLQQCEFKHEGPRAMARSNMEFCQWVIQNIIEKEVK